MSIRFKIMIASLIVITFVVSVITFTMANLFHADKKGYVSDVSALVAGHIADEANTLLDDFAARLDSYARAADDPGLDARTRDVVLQRMAADFPDVVALSLYEGKRRVRTIYSPEALEEAGLTPAKVDADVVAHLEPAAGLLRDGPSIRNSTLVPKFPTFTMAVARERKGKPPLVAIAVVRLDGLLHLSRGSQVFDISLVGTDGVLLAHRDAMRVGRRERIPPPPALSRGVRAEARTYTSDGVEVIGGIASTRIGGLIARAQVPKSAAFFASRALLGRLTSVSLALLILAALSALVWSRTLTRSIRRLVEATGAIGQGRFDVQVDVRSRDEIGTLANSFNRMAHELHTREQKLQQAQGQLVQSEKMAAFGQLGAGFAHEIKNPLAGILGLIQINLRQVESGTPLRSSLETMEKETKRCRAIIDSLLKFARQEKVAHESTDLGRVLHDSAAIMRHQLALHQIDLVLEVPENLPAITGNGNQLQQVLMNLMLNAQQAMKGRSGQVWLGASPRPEGGVQVSVRDDGPGIPADIQRRIFEPFFTTKPAGEGTGLGLSVSFGIIQDHHGEIRVESEPGNGTTFFLDFPDASRMTERESAPPSEPERQAA